MELYKNKLSDVMDGYMEINRSMRRVGVISLITAICGCTTLNEIGKNHGTAFGCASGALLGAAIGASIGDRNTALKGAAIGTGIGCASGYLWQKKLKELEKLAQEENMRIQVATLQQEQTKNNTGKSKSEDVGLVAQIQDASMFSSGSSRPTPQGDVKIRKLANIFAADYDPKGTGVVLVVGHTDSSGGSALNQRLSEERAQSVGRYLQEAGIDVSRVYYQGVGASRPIASNVNIQGRAENRRIEIVEISSAELLALRVEKEKSNIAYLQYSVADKPVEYAGVTAANTAKAPEILAQSKGNLVVDFGGKQVSDSKNSIVSLVKPKRQILSLVSSAYAASSPVSSCAFDSPRVEGEVKNLATGKVLKNATRDFIPGMNERPWSGIVNGHQVVISPVSVLKNDAEVISNPAVYVQKNFNNGNKSSQREKSVVNTYDGEESILYRVFLQDGSRSMECIDLVLSKTNSASVAGEIYYKDSNNKLFVSEYNPKGR